MKTETNFLSRLLMLLVFAVLLLAEAAAAEPSSVLWSVEHDGELRGYLLGTVHSEDPRVAEPPPAIEQAMGKSDVFAMEIVPDMQSLSLLNEAMYYGGAETNLEQEIGADLFAELAAHLEDYGLPREQALTLKPWAAAVMISVPPPDTGLFMDFAYAMQARAEGLEVVSLETVEQQLAFLQGLKPEQELELLRLAIQDYEQMESIHAELMSLYLNGDLNALQEFTDAQMEESSEALKDWFQQQGLDKRNQVMLESMLQHLSADQKTPKVLFTTAGALHLPGEGGLIKLLRAEGYTLKPIPVAFPDS